MDNKMKKGISLIVLVITIIVMIILAATIILSLSKDNIINKANEAVTSTDISLAKERVAVAMAEWDLNKETLSVKYPGGFTDYAKKALEESGFKIGENIGDLHVSSEGTVSIYLNPVVPTGFVASDLPNEDELSEGFVIYSGVDPVSQDADAKTTRDQFVWVPVPDISEFTRTNFYKENALCGSSKDEFSEPYNMLSEANDTTGEYAEFAAMKASVQKYGGFYIARYEAGKETVDGVDILVSKKNATLWSGLGWGANMENIGGNYAVDRCRKMYTLPDAQTHLIYGVQWDTVMKYVSNVVDITDGKSWGNFSDSDGSAATNSGTLQNCGMNDAWVAKNIYDLAGNANEFTMEAHSDNTRRAIRGGYYSLSGESAANVPCSRGRNVVRSCNAWTTFRTAMYLI